jgi:uncharacterized protein YcbK (DUF882 family)
VKVDEVLIISLEELRKLSGGPIYINSGYRCPTHNKVVGGSKHSYHMKGMAVDIRSEVVTPRELVCYARQIPALRGIGLYHNRIHVDIRRKAAYWESNAVICRVP